MQRRAPRGSSDDDPDDPPWRPGSGFTSIGAQRKRGRPVGSKSSQKKSPTNNQQEHEPPPNSSIGLGEGSTSDAVRGRQHVNPSQRLNNLINVEAVPEVSELQSFDMFASAMNGLVQEVASKQSSLVVRVQELEAANAKLQNTNLVLETEVSNLKETNTNISSQFQTLVEAREGQVRTLQEQRKRDLELHDVEMRNSKLMISALASNDVSPWKRDELIRSAKPLASRFKCAMCQDDTLWKTQHVVMPDCMNEEHCLCELCLPGFVRQEVSILMREDGVWKTPSNKLRCPFNMFFSFNPDNPRCKGTLCRDVLKDAFNGVLSTSRYNNGDDSDNGNLTPMQYIDTWRESVVERQYEIKMRQRKEDYTTKAEEISDYQELMRAEGWNTLNHSENKVFECPQCNYGPVILNRCEDLQMHNQETRPGDTATADNRCPRCQFFCSRAGGWNVWKGVPNQDTLNVNLTLRQA